MAKKKKAAAAGAGDVAAVQIFVNAGGDKIALVLAAADVIREDGGNSFGVFIGGHRHPIVSPAPLDDLGPGFMIFKEAGVSPHRVAINPESVTALQDEGPAGGKGNEGARHVGIFAGSARHVILTKASLEEIAAGDIENAPAPETEEA